MDADLAALPPVPAADYIAAVAQHVSSVCVITTVCEGQRFGLTATAVASVCAAPARLLVCINKSGQSHGKILHSGRFCVNVLTEAQDSIAMAFAGMAGPHSDRFASGEWTELVSGAPALKDAAAAFDCRLTEISEQSTHSVLFGDVLATRHRAGEDTLLYGVRRFRQLRKIFSGFAAGDDEYL